MGVLRRLITAIGFKVDEKGFQKADKRTDQLKRGLGEMSAKASNAGSALKGMLAGFVGFEAAKGFISSIVGANVANEKLSATLKTIEGDVDKAALAMEKITKFTSTTPFQINEVAEAFIKLKSLGLDPSERALTAYGNTSAALGKDLNQFIEAVADASTGEFERLKEFGIKASKEGKNVSFTFRGVTKKINNDAKSIQEFLVGIGESDFSGAMADQMETLGGRFSNLKDRSTSLLVAVGKGGLNDAIRDITAEMLSSTEGTEGYASALGEKLGEALRKVFIFTKEVLRVSSELATTFGEKLAPLTAAVAAEMEKLGISQEQVAQGSAAAGVGLAAGGLGKAKSAISGLIPLVVALGATIVKFAPKLVLLAVASGPIGLIIAGIVALVALLVVFRKDIAGFIDGFRGAKGVAGDFARVLAVFTDTIGPVLGDIFDTVGAGLSKMLGFMKRIASMVLKIVIRVAKPVAAVLAFAFKVVAVVVRVLLEIFGVIASVVEAVVGVFVAALSFVFDVIETLLTAVAGVVEPVFNWLSGIVSTVVDAVGGAIDIISPIIFGFFDAVKDIGSAMFDGIFAAFNALVDFVKDAILELPEDVVPDSILAWAKGGQGTLAESVRENVLAQNEANAEDQFQQFAALAGTGPGTAGGRPTNEIGSMTIQLNGIQPNASAAELTGAMKKGGLELLDSASSDSRNFVQFEATSLQASGP